METRDTLALDSCWRHLYCDSGTTAQCKSPSNCASEILFTYLLIVFPDQTICHADDAKDGKDERTDAEVGGGLGPDMMNGSAVKQRKLDSGSSSDEDEGASGGGRKLSKASTVKSGKSVSAKKKSGKPVASKVFSKCVDRPISRFICI